MNAAVLGAAEDALLIISDNRSNSFEVIVSGWRVRLDAKVARAGVCAQFPSRSRHWGAQREAAGKQGTGEGLGEDCRATSISRRGLG